MRQTRVVRFKQLTFLVLLAVAILIVWWTTRNDTSVLLKNVRRLRPTSAQARTSSQINDSWKTPVSRCDDFSQTTSRLQAVSQGLGTAHPTIVSYLRSQSVLVDDNVSGPRAVPDPEFELPLFRYPPLTDLRCLPDPKKSTVQLLTPRGRLSVGDTVWVRVDLLNGYGQRRVGGGDDVRMWLKSDDGNSSIAASVTDLHNGSYVGEAALRWSGVARVRVSLTYSREFLQALPELRFRVQSVRWIAAIYRNDLATQKTPCLPTPHISGCSILCNYTARNGGRPWYCGHPAGQGLNCSHLYQFETLKIVDNLPLSEVMKRHISDIHMTCMPPADEPPDLRLVENSIRLYIAKNPGADVPQGACHARAPRETWGGPTPRGWLRDGAWHEAACRLPPLTPERIRRCIQNTTLMLFGDSNQRRVYNYLRKQMNCDEEYYGPWPMPKSCMVTPVNGSLRLAAHEHPLLYAGNSTWTNVHLPHVLRQLGAEVAMGRRVVLVVHLYLHFTPYAIHLFRHAVRQARADIARFLHAHPHAEVLVRGPHVTYCVSFFQAYLNDHYAHDYRAILRREFAGLLDRVRYMDGWDLTLASENLYTHPDPVMGEIANILLGYVCQGD